MDINTGEVRELTEDEKKHYDQLINRVSPIAATQAMKDIGLMPMTVQQVEATKWRTPRNVRRYMLNQPCTCSSGKQAKRCCYGK